MEADFYSQKHSLFTEFIISIWYAFISNTDLVCYLLVFVNMVITIYLEKFLCNKSAFIFFKIASASVLALPIPFMVFLWGKQLYLLMYSQTLDLLPQAH